MRIVPPGGSVGSRPTGREERTWNPYRPQWLIDWIANKGRYGELSCGCFEYLNDVAFIFKVGGRIAETWCAMHDDAVTVVRKVSHSEYVAREYGIQPYWVPDTPPF